MLASLKEQLNRSAADTSVRVVIIRGAGPLFSAGHDLRELVDGSEADAPAPYRRCQPLVGP
jgi:enoyl-CoA hydratase/carnithine racemase